MTSKVFLKLLGLFILLLVFHTLVMEILFHRFVVHTAGGMLHAVGREAFSSGLLGIMNFARRIADGDFAARLENAGRDELTPLEAALNQTAERLGQDFAELESGRH